MVEPGRDALVREVLAAGDLALRFLEVGARPRQLGLEDGLVEARHDLALDDGVPLLDVDRDDLPRARSADARLAARDDVAVGREERPRAALALLRVGHEPDGRDLDLEARPGDQSVQVGRVATPSQEHER